MVRRTKAMMNDDTGEKAYSNPSTPMKEGTIDGKMEAKG